MSISLSLLRQLSSQARLKILNIIHASKSSHIGSCFSAVDILISLYFSDILRMFPFKKIFQDKVILSKGHAAAALYSILNMKGLISDEVLKTFSSYNSSLLGHVSHTVPGVEFSTGSLGHGLSIAAGIALASARKNLDCNAYVIMSDGELNEGSSWEAILFAGHHKLHKLQIVIDYNNIQSLGSIPKVLNLDSLYAKFQAFNWTPLEVNGHSHKELLDAFKLITDKPKAIIAHTVKGKGVSFMENELKWHYKNPSDEELKIAIEELQV